MRACVSGASDFLTSWTVGGVMRYKVGYCGVRDGHGISTSGTGPSLRLEDNLLFLFGLLSG